MKKYQIQQYLTADLTAERKLIAETEGIFEPEDINAWYFQAITGFVLPEDSTFTIVTEDHAWFMAPASVTVTNTNTDKEVKLLSPEETIQRNKKLVLERRLAQIKLNEEIEQLKLGT